ncbi:HupE/UreJ family protein [Gilvimarinus sp. SDUM040013]|nr:HupE/UreJ family protein [Gilvimarinus sp. SDUM040013]
MSTAYLSIAEKGAGQWDGNLQWRLYDLERLLGLDSNRNGRLTWGELKASEANISQLLHAGLGVNQGAEKCDLSVGAMTEIDTHFNEPYIILPLRFSCSGSGDVALSYSAMFETIASHKLLLNVDPGQSGAAYTRVLSSSQRGLVLTEVEQAWGGFADYVYQGVVHILIGWDHIVFLLCILLVSVLHRPGSQWQPVLKKRTIMLHTLSIVTAFTLAHSLTLTSTALGIIALPSQWVEVGIAATVVIAALNNVFSWVARIGWLTFGFGLLHGMGFAGVLGELGLPKENTVLAVLGFNIGVELGQLAIIMLVLPVLMLSRYGLWYRRWAMPAGSLVIALFGVQWLIARL